MIFALYDFGLINMTSQNIPFYLYKVINHDMVVGGTVAWYVIEVIFIFELSSFLGPYLKCDNFQCHI